MYAFGVTLWEIFSSHVPYDTEKKPANELIDELRDLLTDRDDPLRPDLQLVDLRVRPLLQVCARVLESLFDCSSLQPQRCWAMDPQGRISAADLFNELQKLPRNASWTAAAQVADAAVSSASSLLDDLMGGFGVSAPAPAPVFSNLPVICTAQQGKGMEIKGHLVRRNGESVYDFVISNQTQQPLSGFAIQFNKNMFSVMPGTIPAITGSNHMMQNFCICTRCLCRLIFTR